jgi:hypothetical protein
MRLEQNGAKRPTSGTCAAIWDYLDNNRDITSKELKPIAEANGWNISNAITELYQWRRFNGIFKKALKRELVTNYDVTAPFELDGPVSKDEEGNYTLGGTPIGKCYQIPTLEDPTLGIEFFKTPRKKRAKKEDLEDEVTIVEDGEVVEA